MAETVWTDEALEVGRDDTLGRLSYAQRAAERLHRTHSFESSAVFGLSGPWGSGKTSLVNMIIEELENKHPEWAVARFTPWATSDVAGLLGEFYSSLAGALPKKRSKQVRRALAVTASVAAPAVNLIPVAGGVAAEGFRIAGEALGKSPSWQAAFTKASEELKELKTPILVVVDDIDRLHGDELLALLKVVRLLGRFDGVQYLLAYDDETLYRSMRVSGAVTAGDGSAERFMEKIVQYPLFVPPLLRHQQITRLNTGLESVTRHTIDDGSDGQRLSGLIDCFTNLLRTPRAIDRYIAQLRHHIPLLEPDEVDDEDVHLLTLIRVSCPSLFTDIPRYRAELISGHTGEWKRGAGPLEHVSFDIEPLLKDVPAELRRSAQDLLVALFPKVAEEGRHATYGSRRHQSIQHDEYFDRYFAMSILDHDISDITVEVAIRAAVDGNATPLRDLLLGTPGERRSLALSKFLGPINQPTTDADRIQLAEIMAGIANDLPSHGVGPFSDQDRVLAWIGRSLAQLDKQIPAQTLHTVLWKLDGSALRIQAWRSVEYNIEETHRSGLPDWYDEVMTMLVDDATTGILEHLRQGDDAEIKSGIGYQVQFILRHQPERLRAEVHELLASDTIDLSILASRLVSARTITGVTPDWHLSKDFEQDTFNQLAPPSDDPWYHQPKQEDLDLRDLSWANRRAFATGRVEQPPLDTANPEPPSASPTS